MSDESATSPESSAVPSTGGAKRPRRVSSPRPKKAAKPTKAGAESAAPEVTPEPPVSKFPMFPESSEASETPASRTDWPEPEAASSSASTPPENPKRKRRRKKGKGNAAQNAAPQADAEIPPTPREESTTPQPPRQNQPPRTKVDTELLAKFAWKIYLAEISEEGVALVGDNDAKELSRRCFRLAEIFMEEQARRR